jgi:hypothetical protein
MKTINIITAILLSIRSFGNDQFSIFDITSNIRENLNDGEYELSIFGDRIAHDVVKTHFTELADYGFLSDYSMKHENGYRVFKRTQALATTTINQSTNAPTPAATTIPSDVQLIIYKYLKGRSPVTMKQIQSRLKGHTYTCQEIKDFLAAINLVDNSTVNNTPSKVLTTYLA